jgi:hypothetical protein
MERRRTIRRATRSNEVTLPKHPGQTNLWRLAIILKARNRFGMS